MEYSLFHFLNQKQKREKCLKWISLCGRPHKDFNVDKIRDYTYICSKDFVFPYSHCHQKDETECDLCRINTEADVVVRDHNHVDGSFRNAAHKDCNLNYRMKADKLKIPIFFHNLKGYDAHLILSYLDPEKNGRVTCIPKTTEQYTSFTIGNMIFKDSLAFL